MNNSINEIMTEARGTALKIVANEIAHVVNFGNGHMWYALEHGNAFVKAPKIVAEGLHEWIDLNYEGWQLSLLPEGELFLEQHHAKKEYQSFYPKSAEEVLIIMRATRK